MNLMKIFSGLRLQESILETLLELILMTMIVSNLYCYVYLTIHHIWYIHTNVHNMYSIIVPTVHCTELNINFQLRVVAVMEGDQGETITVYLREVENSFTLTLYPVTITEARNPDNYNVSAFVADVSEGEQATPGKGVVPSQKYMLAITRKFVESGRYNY